MAIPSVPPLRIFLDAGVIIEGCFAQWGASKGILILATIQANWTIVLAQAVEREVRRAAANKAASADGTERAAADIVAGWMARVRLEHHGYPTDDELRMHAPVVMPALRHQNDLPAVVTAIKAKPDWVLSTNTTHWNQPLAQRTGLRIATPSAFLQQLVLPTGR